MDIANLTESRPDMTNRVAARPRNQAEKAMFKSLFAKISPFLIVKEAKAGAKKITANEQRLVDFCALAPDEAQTRLKTVRPD